WSLSSLLVTVRSQTSKRRDKNRCSWKRREGPGEVAGPKRLARSATEAAPYPSTTRIVARARRPVLSAAAAGRSDVTPAQRQEHSRRAVAEAPRLSEQQLRELRPSCSSANRPKDNRPKNQPRKKF